MPWESVPICNYCWRLREGDRQPIRLRNRKKEQCHFCTEFTYSGIYTRAETESETT